MTVGVPTGTDLSVTPKSLQFSAARWNAALRVTVSASEDDDAVNDSATLTHTATGGDYGSVSKSLTATVTDNDTAGLVLSASSLTVAEGGDKSYTVKLATEPSGEVTVTVGGTSGEVTVDKSSLTFGTGTWSTAQTVTVSAGHDDDGANDSATLSHTAAGADYAGKTKTLSVTVTDDDTPALVVSKTALTVAEGGSGTYTVKLATQPTGQVTVTVSGTSDTDLSLDKSSLTFGTSNWRTAQTVRVTAGQDDGAGDDSATLTHTAAGADYAGKSKTLAVTVDDDDTAALVLSKTSLTVAENSNASYTVKLATEPTAEVVVTVGGTTGTDLNVPQKSLTFSTSNWSTDQTVTVGALPDADAVNDSATLTHRASGGDYAGKSANVAVTVTDDDTAALELSKTVLTVAEGGRGSYTVKLATEPTAEVVVTVGGTRGTDLTLGKSSLTFSTSTWATAQTVTVRAQEDDDAGDDRAMLSHTASGGDYGGKSASVAVTVDDNDTAALVVSATSLTVAEGGSGTYTVKLATEPSGTVTVTVTGTTGTDLRLGKSSLTFSTSNWNKPQTVRVSANHDDDAGNDSATLSHTASGADYGTAAAVTVAVTVTDDDTAALVLSKTTLAVTEGADSSYTVKLATQPTGTVTVTVGGTSGEVTVDKSSLTFSTSNWSTAQTVRVTAGEDADAVNDSATLTHTASGGDYAGKNANLAVAVTDNDAAALELSEATLSVPEGGDSTYTVKLVTQPSGEVTVTVGGTSGEVTVDKSSLTFSPSDWSTAQTVTVSAGQDDDAVNDSATLSHTASGGDYGSVSKELAVTVTDDDTAGLVLAPDSLTVAEGSSATYAVALATQPSGEVTVAVTGMTGTDLMLDKSSLTFSPSEWSTAQTVTVTAKHDDDTAVDSATLTHSATGGGYGSVSRDLEVTVTDDDTAGLVLDPDSLAVSEGASETYTVALATQPSAEVTVAVTGTAGTDLTLGKASLTFSPSEWSTAQTVTVSAGEDDDAANDSATLTHTAVGGEYGSVSRDLAVTVTDNDTSALVLDPTSLTVAEGSTATYTVTLATPPSETVTVTVGGTAGTDLTLDESSLTFSPSEWSTAQTVTVSAGEDEDTVDDSATLSHTASGGEYGSVTRDLAVTVTDDDGVSLMVESAKAMEDDTTMDFKLSLTRESRRPVTVEYETVDGTAVKGTDYTAMSGVLTVASGQMAKTIAIPIQNDSEDEPDEEFALSFSNAKGAALMHGEQTLTVIGVIIDDDPPVERQLPRSTSVMLSVDPDTVAEDEGATTVSVTATLNGQPLSGDITVTTRIGGGTAGAGTDFTAEPASLVLTISAGATTGGDVFTLAPVDDTLDEADETVLVNGTVSGASLAVTGATVTIVDDDEPPRLSIEDASAEENEGVIAFRVSLDRASGRRITVAYTTQDDTATAAADYEAARGVLTLEPGQTEGQIRVTVIDDHLDEPDETFRVLLSEPTNVELGTDSATGTIIDDDEPPMLSIEDARAVENEGEIVFRVRLERASGMRITVVYTTQDGTATALADYEPEFDVLTLEAGQTEAEIRVAVYDDRLYEPDETFEMLLSEPVNVQPETGSATGTIVDDDAPMARMWLSRFGRAVASELVAAVDGRLYGAGRSHSQASIGGHRLQPAGEDPERVDPVLWEEQTARAVRLAELVGGSAFLVAEAGREPAAEEADRVAVAGAGGGEAGGSWMAWGRGSATGLAGREGDLKLTGQVVGGIGGFDYDWGWMLTGLAAAYNVGEGEVTGTGAAARSRAVVSTLASVHPYVRVGSADGLSLWGMLGYGLGVMSMAGGEKDTGIEMKMAAYGARGSVLGPSAGGLALDLKSDGFLMLMNTRAAPGRYEVKAEASRVRLLLDGSLPIALGGAGTLAPSVEVGVRYDAGDAENGFGAELGGTVRYQLPIWGLSLDANGRVLLAHQDRDYREWGVGGALHLDPGTPGRGARLDVSSSWGPTATATERVWSIGDPGGLIAGNGGPESGRISAELGYGVAAFGGAMLMTPRVGFALDESGGHTYSAGGEMNYETALRISLEGTHAEASDTPPTSRLNLGASLRW